MAENFHQLSLVTCIIHHITMIGVIYRKILVEDKNKILLRELEWKETIVCSSRAPLFLPIFNVAIEYPFECLTVIVFNYRGTLQEIAVYVFLDSRRERLCAVNLCSPEIGRRKMKWNETKPNQTHLIVLFSCILWWSLLGILVYTSSVCGHKYSLNFDRIWVFHAYDWNQ